MKTSKYSHVCAWGVACLMATLCAAPLLAEDEAKKADNGGEETLKRPVVPTITGITFKGRYKLEQSSVHILKVRVDPTAFPLNADLLNIMLDGKDVMGNAAEDTFGLDKDEYHRHVDALASVSSGDGQHIIRLTLTAKAERRVPQEAFDRFAKAVSIHLRQAIRNSIITDRAHVASQREALVERRHLAEQELLSIREERMGLTERAGLVESSMGGDRGTMAGYERDKQAAETNLAVLKGELKAMNKLIESGEVEEVDPKADTVAKEIAKLIDEHQRRVKEVERDKYATDEQKSEARTALLEARIRYEQRLKEVVDSMPVNRVKALKVEIAKTEARIAHVDKSIEEMRKRLRGRHRDAEEISLLKDREKLAIERLASINERLEKIDDLSDALKTITVTLVGSAPGSTQ